MKNLLVCLLVCFSGILLKADDEPLSITIPQSSSSFCETPCLDKSCETPNLDKCRSALKNLRFCDTPDLGDRLRCLTPKSSDLLKISTLVSIQKVIAIRKN